MSDRAPATFTIYRVRGKEQLVAELLEEHGFGTDWASYTVRAEDIVDGGCYCDDEANLAVLTDLGNELQRAGISYIGAQDAKYEYDGEVHMFTPELGLFRSTGSNGGEVLVTSTDLDQALERAGEDLSALRTDIEGFTGKAWTDALSTELTRGGTENQAYRVFRAEGLSVADAEVAVRATTVGTTA